MIVSTKSLAALDILSNASTIIAEGEVSQLAQLESKKIISEQEYMSVINAKTAELFSAACCVGAIIAEKMSEATLLKEFGLRLGNIFQIVDDTLDYFSDGEKTGKNIGDDFYEGKITLPIIFLRKKLPLAEKIILDGIFIADKRSKSDFSFTKELMLKYNVKGDLHQYLHELKSKAESILKSIHSDHKSQEYLYKLVDFAINRSY